MLKQCIPSTWNLQNIWLAPSIMLMLISGTRSQFNLLVVNLIDRQALCSICKVLMLSLSTLSSFDCGSLVVICALKLAGYCHQNNLDQDKSIQLKQQHENMKGDKWVLYEYRSILVTRKRICIFLSQNFRKMVGASH